jgi:hypothetical protein
MWVRVSVGAGLGAGAYELGCRRLGASAAQVWPKRECGCGSIIA